jgi:hypothetical protein
VSHTNWRSSTRGKLAKFGYRFFRDTSRILFFKKKVSYYILAWDFLGLSSSQNVPQKKRKKKEKQIATLIGPIGHAQNRIIYIYMWVSFFNFVLAFSLYIIVKIQWQI